MSYDQNFSMHIAHLVASLIKVIVDGNWWGLGALLPLLISCFCQSGTCQVLSLGLVKANSKHQDLSSSCNRTSSMFHDLPFIMFDVWKIWKRKHDKKLEKREEKEKIYIFKAIKLFVDTFSNSFYLFL